MLQRGPSGAVSTGPSRRSRARRRSRSRGVNGSTHVDEGFMFMRYDHTGRTSRPIASRISCRTTARSPPPTNRSARSSRSSAGTTGTTAPRSRHRRFAKVWAITARKHGLFLYEPTIHVPFIIKTPKRVPAFASDAPCSHRLLPRLQSPVRSARPRGRNLRTLEPAPGTAGIYRKR